VPARKQRELAHYQKVEQMGICFAFSLLDFRAMGRMFGREGAGGVLGLLRAAVCLLVYCSSDRER